MAQISSLHAGVVEQIFGAVFHDNASHFHDIAACGDFEGGFGVLFDDENGYAVFVDFFHGFENGFDEKRGKTEGGFVKKQDFGLSHEGAAYGEHLLFAAGKGACHLAAAFVQAGEKTVNPVKAFGYDVFVVYGEGAELEVFIDGQGVEHASAFGGLGQAAGNDFVALQFADFFPCQAYAAAHNGGEAAYGVHGGGFSRTVCTQYADDFAFVDVQAYAVQDFDLSVSCAQIVQF